VKTEIEIYQKLGHVIDQYQEDYYYLMSHIDAFTRFLDEECNLTSTVWVLPVSTTEDIGIKHIDIIPEEIVGIQATNRAIDHLSDHRLKHKQSGLFAKRLPGVIKVKTKQKKDFLMRVQRINEIKDNLERYLIEKVPNIDDRFVVTKAAVPYAIRKAISRHIHVIDDDTLRSIGLSISTRTSMSAIQDRDAWIKKLKRSKAYKANQVNGDEWVRMVEVEEKRLAKLSQTAKLRTIRPLRKAPIMNIYYHGGKKGTIIAHSPLFVLNEEVKVNSFRPYTGNAKDKNIREPIIPRWHLYEVKGIQ
jgi:hypothetical protein